MFKLFSIFWCINTMILNYISICWITHSMPKFIIKELTIIRVITRYLFLKLQHKKYFDQFLTWFFCMRIFLQLSLNFRRVLLKTCKLYYRNINRNNINPRTSTSFSIYLQLHRHTPRLFAHFSATINETKLVHWRTILLRFSKPTFKPKLIIDR